MELHITTTCTRAQIMRTVRRLKQIAFFKILQSIELVSILAALHLTFHSFSSFHTSFVNFSFLLDFSFVLSPFNSFFIPFAIPYSYFFISPFATDFRYAINAIGRSKPISTAGCSDWRSQAHTLEVQTPRRSIHPKAVHTHMTHMHSAA